MSNLIIKKITAQDVEKVDYNVVLANNLIMANHDLTLNENKLILAVISQISLYDKDIMEIEFTTKQICKLCNFPQNHINRTLSNARKNLLNKTFTIEHTIRRNDKWETINSQCHWVSRISFNENRWIIKLSENLKPFILALKENFTIKKLNQIELYNNNYALRFDLIFTMEFNKQTSKMNEEKTLTHQIRKRFTIDNLRELFLCKEKYVKTKDFMKYVIYPAIQEINDIGFYNVSLEKVNKRIAIEELVFFVSLGENNDKKVSSNSVDKNIEKIFLSSGFSKSELTKISKDFSSEDIINALKVVRDKRKQGIGDGRKAIEEALEEIKTEKNLDSWYDSL